MTEIEATWFTVAIVIACPLITVFIYIVFEYYKNNILSDLNRMKTVEANKGKTVFETLPELNQIARELGVNVNNWKVIEEYFNRHPEERSQQELKSNKTLKK